MRCIALLSGGKDSVAAVHVARQSGWDVVAGLRMIPEADDAYMFHTPNLPVVEAVAECLDMPLRTASTRDDPVAEVAELEQALARAKQDLGLDAVVSGALRSEYQRTRIDRIGHRLGLKTFAPLWHKPAKAYVRGLIRHGWDIRLSRVACDGLDERWAGHPLDDAALGFMVGLSHPPDVAGEGGEYETLVLDCPAFMSRIVVDASEVETTASRATWHVRQWHTEPKPARSTLSG